MTLKPAPGSEALLGSFFAGPTSFAGAGVRLRFLSLSHALSACFRGKPLREALPSLLGYF
jgi:hypothetical protein